MLTGSPVWKQDSINGDAYDGQSWCTDVVSAGSLMLSSGRYAVSPSQTWFADKGALSYEIRFYLEATPNRGTGKCTLVSSLGYTNYSFWSGHKGLELAYDQNTGKVGAYHYGQDETLHEVWTTEAVSKESWHIAKVSCNSSSLALTLDGGTPVVLSGAGFPDFLVYYQNMFRLAVGRRSFQWQYGEDTTTNIRVSAVAVHSSFR
jgi:hypothetical protein